MVLAQYWRMEQGIVIFLSHRIHLFVDG